MLLNSAKWIHNKMESIILINGVVADLMHTSQGHIVTVTCSFPEDWSDTLRDYIISHSLPVLPSVIRTT